MEKYLHHKPMIHVVLGVIICNHHVLLAKRTAEQTLSGYWEFPGGKVEPNETLLDALARELKEEVNIEVVKPVLFHDKLVEYDKYFIHLYGFVVSEYHRQLKHLEGNEILWCDLDSISDMPIIDANHEFIDCLRDYLN